MSRSSSVVILSGLALIFGARDAQAYIDPGTGSLVLQALIGGAAAAALLLRRYWQRLRHRFGRPPRPQDPKSS